MSIRTSSTVALEAGLALLGANRRRSLAAETAERAQTAAEKAQAAAAMRLFLSSDAARGFSQCIAEAYGKDGTVRVGENLFWTTQGPREFQNGPCGWHMAQPELEQVNIVWLENTVRGCLADVAKGGQLPRHCTLDGIADPYPVSYPYKITYPGTDRELAQKALEAVRTLKITQAAQKAGEVARFQQAASTQKQNAEQIRAQLAQFEKNPVFVALRQAMTAEYGRRGLGALFGLDPHGIALTFTTSGPDIYYTRGGFRIAYTKTGEPDFRPLSDAEIVRYVRPDELLDYAKFRLENFAKTGSVGAR